MSQSSPQDFKHHTRVDAPFHMVLFTVLFVNLFIVISFAVKSPSIFSAWIVLLSIAVFIPVFRMRQYPLMVQDRVIRIEERLRLQALAPAEWHTQIYRLTVDQLIGLRFASDDEVVELAKLALEHKLNRKEIKERIKSWRPDDLRV